MLLDHGIVVETGGHGERTFRGQDLIVVSPGVPVDSPPLVQARALGETVIGEIELASRFLPEEYRRHHRVEWQDDDYHSGGEIVQRAVSRRGGRQYRNACDLSGGAGEGRIP